VRSFEEETCTLPPLLGYLKEEPEEDALESSTKKRKLDLDLIPSSESASPFSFSFAPFDYLLTHILSYDQVLDTICQSISTQLIFNRGYFHRNGLDPNTLLQTMRQKCSVITVDFREFPGKLISNFFHWLYECAFKTTPPADFPQVYCLICGCPDSENHDIHSHTQFYNSLDQPLLEKWKAKASNFYDFVKELISYLLRYPNSRQSFRKVVENSLHCPFCAHKNGTHCQEVHERWKTLYHIDCPPEPSMEPEKTDNLDTYTKSSFQFLMDQMPFQVPSFLLSLHNVQSFLDCLVAIWRSLRLTS